MRLDSRDSFPSGMEEYLATYGWHFSKKMCEWASSRMYKRNKSGDKEYIKVYTKEDLEKLMKVYSVNLPFSYDALYIANMCKADYLGGGVPTEAYLTQYVKSTIEDPDGYDGMPFTRFYADCIGSGTPIDWEDMI